MTDLATSNMGLEAIDTIMRVAHNLRREAQGRELTAPECAVMAFDLRLKDAGWTWTADGPVAPPLVKGRVATLVENPSTVEDVRRPGWKLHRCADGEQCRAEIGGGCASGWCGHFEVCPDEEGVPRFPVGR
jgi:hypothetical protein